MRKTIIALVVALASLVPGGAIAQQSPESKEKMTDLQGDAPSEYTVVKGDTLTKLGYSPLTMEVDYFQFIEAGMKQIADQCKVEVVTADPSYDRWNQLS